VYDGSLSVDLLSNVTCVQSQIYPGSRVCRGVWALGCFSTQDNCADGYECRDMLPDSYCIAVGFANGERCDEGANCDSAICGPERKCQAGAAGDPCNAAEHCESGICGSGGECEVSL
jgi:hypothetical protein